MFTSITSHAGALVTAIVALTGGAILHGGAAAADPNQDGQFLALLEQEEIPAVDNVPSLIATAHQVCRKLDGGMPVDALVDAMRNDAYKTGPMLRRFPPARVTHTMTRFITAAVETYCPYDRSKIASITAIPPPGSNEPMHGVAYTHTGWDEDRTVLASRIGVVPSGEITPPDPPQIPAPAPPTAQLLTPPRPNAAPPPPKQSPPPPQQVEPSPQQADPPAVAPQPGGGAGSGGSGSTGGNGGGGAGGSGGDGGEGPAEPSPAPPMAPGWVRLAP